MVDGVLTCVEIGVCIKRLGEDFTYFIIISDIFLLSRSLSFLHHRSTLLMPMKLGKEKQGTSRILVSYLSVTDLLIYCV